MAVVNYLDKIISVSSREKSQIGVGRKDTGSEEIKVKTKENLRLKVSHKHMRNKQEQTIFNHNGSLILSILCRIITIIL